MANYVRQSSFSNGDVIDATTHNAEYDQLAAAFVASTGHKHNGDVGEGGFIPLISLEDETTGVRLDNSDANNHKIIFKIDGVDVMTLAEDVGLSVDNLNIAIEELNNVNAPVADGFFRWNNAADTVEFSATNGELKDTSDIGTPVNSGFWRWDGTSTTVTYSATIAHTDLTGLDSNNFTHNAGNMKVFLDDLDVRVADAEADAAAAAVSAAEAVVSAGEAEAAADRAENAVMEIGLPTFIADAGSYVITAIQEIVQLVYEGDGTLTLPASLIKGSRFTIRLERLAEDKIVTIGNPNFTIIGSSQTLTAGMDLELEAADLVVLEAINTTTLEII